MTNLRFGIALPQAGAIAPETVVAVARAARDAGLASLWVSDHVAMPAETRARYPFGRGGSFNFPPTVPRAEALTTLAFAAAAAPGLQIGISALILPQRNPVLAAKQLATLDVLSGGGLLVALGAGWLEEEFVALGAAPFAERGAVLDEYVDLLRALWTTECASFQGRYYQVDRVYLLPHPLQRPTPPLWIGGHSRAALRRAAARGDGWHAAFLGPAAFADAIERLAVEAADLGRPMADLTLSLRCRLAVRDAADPAPDGELVGPPAVLAERIRAYERAGARHIVLTVGSSAEPTAAILHHLERFATEVLPLVA
jgi:probable F420-dependent oxidoreductase